ncbi:MAG: hypothetical protein PHY74_05540 [Candidatus Bathyarchaeota archaeon]|nr:hypothetical protein [Candidatus Bathyarchaeota archaeon]MDD4326276.1 hypothetical protein [Candidatus Bathyarchaeota archaeon]
MSWTSPGLSPPLIMVTDLSEGREKRICGRIHPAATAAGILLGFL